MGSSSALSSVARIAQLPAQKKSTSFKSRRSSIVRAAKREEVRARADVLFGFVVLILGRNMFVRFFVAICAEQMWISVVALVRTGARMEMITREGDDVHIG